MYTEKEIRQIVDDQRRFFNSGKTLDIDWRLRRLHALKSAVIRHKSDLEEAL